MEWAKELSKACDVLNLNDLLNAKGQGKTKAMWLITDIVDLIILMQKMINWQFCVILVGEDPVFLDNLLRTCKVLCCTFILWRQECLNIATKSLPSIWIQYMQKADFIGSQKRPLLRYCSLRFDF